VGRIKEPARTWNDATLIAVWVVVYATILAIFNFFKKMEAVMQQENVPSEVTDPGPRPKSSQGE